MTTTPAGAVAGNWFEFSGVPGDVMRYLTWSRHDAAGAVIAVEGTQAGDGQLISRCISVYENTEELTAVQARQLAAALLNAADSLDALT
ncbi:hypothetical protein [Mycobacterium asiaticum]|uniref:hypothetical protein n=1 Tax=Mycobacterium asiaticum TaxID=1790 RepID=UPI0005684E07|nr:hypothetical protein [Mycobacterium asiaticum]ORA13585.1 hypothetical protein BST16_14045 [Mycobacterium asiaticum DSM 44297]